MIENSPQVDVRIKTALEEDMGFGDVTTDATVEERAHGSATLIARQDLVLAGLPVFKRVFEILGSDTSFEDFFEDGSAVPSGSVVCRIEGPLAVILRGERTALNFLQRMCGIATLTRSFAEQIRGLKARVLDTRKTAPGLRLFDKYAVRVGGGTNHRMGLFDGVLIKDNHIAACGSIGRAVSSARQAVPHTLKIEVEVTSLDEVQEALDAGADIVMLDNMAEHEMREAVNLIDGSAIVEASGNISIDSVRSVAETGVDLISVGALTHSARAADLSLLIEGQ